VILVLVPGDGVRRLDRWHRLAGQHALIALELIDRQQPQVGWEDVTDAQRDYVAGHQVKHGYPASLPVPADLGLMPDLGTQRSHRRLCAVLVEEPEAHAESDDPQ
jgi:hypothetical protein